MERSREGGASGARNRTGAFQVREIKFRQVLEPPQAKGSVSRDWGGNRTVAVARAGGQGRMPGAGPDHGFGLFLREGLASVLVDGRFGVSLPCAASGMRVAIQDRAVNHAAAIASEVSLHVLATDPGDRAPWQDGRREVPENHEPEASNLAALSGTCRSRIATMQNAARVRPQSAELHGLAGSPTMNAVEAGMMGAGLVTILAAAADAPGIPSNGFKTAIVAADGAGLAVRIAHHQPAEITARPVKMARIQGAGYRFLGIPAAGRAAGAAVETSCRAVSWPATGLAAGFAAGLVGQAWP